MQADLNVRNSVVLKEKMLKEGVSIDDSVENLIKRLNPLAKNIDCANISVVNGIFVNVFFHKGKKTDLSIIAKAGPNNWGNIVIYYNGTELFEAKIIV